MRDPIDWQHRVSPPHPGLPASELVLPHGKLQVPATGPRPRLESYLATVPTSDWNDVTDALESYWQKLGEMLYQFYIKQAKESETSSSQAILNPSWNRIVCLIDLIYGKVTSSTWNNDAPAARWEPLWVIIRFPGIDQLLRNVSEDQFVEEAGSIADRLTESMKESIARPAATASLQKLKTLHPCSIWVMQEEQPETLMKIA